MLSALALLAVATPGPAAPPQIDRAEVRADGRRLYSLEKVHTPRADGALHVRSVYRDGRGATALVMEAVLRGGRPVRVEVTDHQTRTRGIVRVRPGRVAFETTGADGETHRDEVDVMGVVMVGPGLTRYLQSDEAWKRLLRKEKVRLQIAAWERRDTYPFDLHVVGGDADTLVVAMAPATWIVRAFVDEMRYTFDRRTRRLLRYRGPVGVKAVDEDGDLGPLVAEVVYAPEQG